MSKELTLLKQAAHEIKRLQNDNAIMSARLQVFDTLTAIFEGQPRSRIGGLQSPDFLYELEKFILSQQEKEKIAV